MASGGLQPRAHARRGPSPGRAPAIRSSEDLWRLRHQAGVPAARKPRVRGGPGLRPSDQCGTLVFEPRGRRQVEARFKGSRPRRCVLEIRDLRGVRLAGYANGLVGYDPVGAADSWQSARGSRARSTGRASARCARPGSSWPSDLVAALHRSGADVQLLAFRPGDAPVSQRPCSSIRSQRAVSHRRRPVVVRESIRAPRRLQRWSGRQRPGGPGPIGNCNVLRAQKAGCSSSSRPMATATAATIRDPLRPGRQHAISIEVPAVDESGLIRTLCSCSTSSTATGSRSSTATSARRRPTSCVCRNNILGADATPCSLATTATCIAGGASATTTARTWCTGRPPRDRRSGPSHAKYDAGLRVHGAP